VVTTFGSYSGTLHPGVSFTLPWPIQSVETRDVTSIQRFTFPEGDSERLMLTGDQNLVNLSYLVRWNIKDLKLYTFQLAEPDQTVREVAEASMRAAIAEVTLNDAMGTGRAMIEQNVRERMQRVLDAYHSGVKIQGSRSPRSTRPQRSSMPSRKCSPPSRTRRARSTARRPGPSRRPPPRRPPPPPSTWSMASTSWPPK
jgi:regulator of protease activity HflC (stomatin/prohibitin superfamily)